LCKVGYHKHGYKISIISSYTCEWIEYADVISIECMPKWKFSKFAFLKKALIIHEENSKIKRNECLINLYIEYRWISSWMTEGLFSFDFLGYNETFRQTLIWCGLSSLQFKLNCTTGNMARWSHANLQMFN
jgi:hypothetical protein